jgi:hypothetical protein
MDEINSGPVQFQDCVNDSGDYAAGDLARAQQGTDVIRYQCRDLE